jgi:hypothetical protein
MSKLPPKKHFSAEVLRARAGIIPASDHIENELNARVTRVGKVVDAFGRSRHGQADAAVTDILLYLRNYCDVHALSFVKLDAVAAEYYQEDVNDSPWISRMSSEAG